MRKTNGEMIYQKQKICQKQAKKPIISCTFFHPSPLFAKDTIDLSMDAAFAAEKILAKN